MTWMVRRGRAVVWTRAQVAGVVVLAGAGLTSMAAAGLPPFTEEAGQRGIQYTANQPTPFGEGVAFVDLDGDGDPDIVTLGSTTTGSIGLYENDGTGQFQRRPAPNPQFANGVSAADFDRDGDLDLSITCNFRPNLLLRNEGDFSFVDVAMSAGVDDDGDSHGSAWGDFDGDGWIDLYVSNRTQPNKLYRNLGGEPGASSVTFEDVAELHGVDLGNQPTFQGSFFDYDRDGDLDLYVATDKGTNECQAFQNHLFQNIGGTFIDVTDAETEGCLDAMCIAIGDFDGNQLPDMYVTNTEEGHALMLNKGDDRWRRSEAEAGVVVNWTGWGANFLDVNNDGRLDLFVVHAGINGRPRLFINGPDWPLVDSAVEMGLGQQGSCFGSAAGDVDGDGDVDLLVSVRNQPIRLFINHAGGLGRAVSFDVKPTEPGAPIAGTVVDVRAGDMQWTRDVVAGSSFKSQDQQLVHLGLGGSPLVEEVSVRWPDGSTRTVANLPTNRVWPLWPESRLGDVNGDGVRDVTDLGAMASCHTGPALGTMSTDCAILDMDGDGDVDALDCVALLQADYLGPIEDCDGNGITDAIEIVTGDAPDVNGDGIHDGCQIAPADLNGDFTVDGADLVEVVMRWGDVGGPADLDGSGTVAFGDLLMVLMAWTG